MFPSDESPFGGASGAEGPFEGGRDFGPPPADGIFDSAFEDIDSLSEDEKFLEAAKKKKQEDEVLAVGLHFFDGMKEM